MRSRFDAMPFSMQRAMRKFGSDINIARRRRHLTLNMMAERASIARSTYQRIEQGDPSVALGHYAMVLQALGLGDRLSSLLDMSKDDTGLLLDRERLARRVVPSRKVKPR